MLSTMDENSLVIRYIIVKLQNTEINKKILRVPEKKEKFTYNVLLLKIGLDFQEQHWKFTHRKRISSKF